MIMNVGLIGFRFTPRPRKKPCVKVVLPAPRSTSWLAAPVLGDEAEQAVLDLVPLAGAVREVADGDRHPDFIGELLQFHLPEPHSGTVAATSIGNDEQSIGLGIDGLPHRLPPTPDACRGKSCGVVIHAHADPTCVVGQIVNAIGIGSTQFRDEKVMHSHWFRIPFRTQFPPAVLEVAYKLLLFRVG